MNKIIICLFLPISISENRGDKMRELRNAKTMLDADKMILHVISPGPKPKIKSTFHEIKLFGLHSIFVQQLIIFFIGIFKAFYVSLRYKPDIFFVRGEFPIFIAWAMKRIFRIPFITDMIFIDLDFLEKWFEKEKTKGRYYVDVNDDRIKKKYSTHNRFAKIFNRFAFSDASLFTMEMDFQIRLLHDMGVPKERLFQLLPSIDLEKFKPSENVHYDYDCIFIGGLDDSHVRMISPVIERLQKIISKIPNFKLVIVGGGSHENTLKNIIRKLNASDHVVFKGHQSNDAVKDILSRSKVALAFSTGQKCYEYMAMGKPVIAFRGENSKSVLGNAAMYADTWDEYVDCIIHLLKNPEKSRELSMNGRKLAESRSIDKISAEFYDRIKTILGK